VLALRRRAVACHRAQDAQQEGFVGGVVVKVRLLGWLLGHETQDAVADLEVVVDDAVELPVPALEDDPVVGVDAVPDRGEALADREVERQLEAGEPRQERERIRDREPTAVPQDVEGVDRVRGRDEERPAVGDLEARAEDVARGVEAAIPELPGPATLEASRAKVSTSVPQSKVTPRGSSAASQASGGRSVTTSIST
jgi:hypothetical protein